MASLAAVMMLCFVPHCAFCQGVLSASYGKVQAFSALRKSLDWILPGLTTDIQRDYKHLFPRSYQKVQ